MDEEVADDGPEDAPPLVAAELGLEGLQHPALVPEAGRCVVFSFVSTFR